MIIQRSGLMHMLYPEIVVAGCGNPLFTDDGFGPAVIEELKKAFLPGNVKAVDAGTAGPDYVFSMLDPRETKKLIIIDIVDFGSAPGETTMIKFTDIPRKRIYDAEPGGISESLQLIKNYIEVIVIGCQPKNAVTLKMEIGLSQEVRKAIPRAVRMVFDLVGVDYSSSCKFFPIHSEIKQCDYCIAGL